MVVNLKCKITSATLLSILLCIVILITGCTHTQSDFSNISSSNENVSSETSSEALSPTAQNVSSETSSKALSSTAQNVSSETSSKALSSTAQNVSSETSSKTLSSTAQNVSSETSSKTLSSTAQNVVNNKSSAFTDEQYKVFKKALNDTINIIYTTVPQPNYGSIGGEWAIFGLARSEYELPFEYFEDYYKRIENYVASQNGDLHKNKYTEYSRLIIALTSIGKDPTNVVGYNLLQPLADYDTSIKQGLNGAIMALIAFDCGSYNIPTNIKSTTQATRELYIDRILQNQHYDGGFSLRTVKSEEDRNESSDVDITAMALQALAKYRHIDKVKVACDNAIDFLSNAQNDDGTYTSWGTCNSESCAQTICALNELGISLNDERFIKNGNTVLDALLTFYIEGEGFAHSKEMFEKDLMATEQALYALVSIKRLQENKTSLYSAK